MMSFMELAHMIVEAGKSEIQEADWQVETQAGAEAAIWAVFLLLQGKLNFTLRDFPVIEGSPPILSRITSFS